MRVLDHYDKTVVVRLTETEWSAMQTIHEMMDPSVGGDDA